MRKLKKALSLSLALVLSLALAVPAFAAPVVLEPEHCFDYSDYEFKDNKITLSDVVSQEMVKQMEYGEPGQQDIPLITVKVGTTITTELEISQEILEAYITNDGYYDYSLEETSKSFPMVGLSYTLNEECIGLWGYININGSGLARFYLNVIAADGSTPIQPTTPTTPTQPEQPTEPTTPIEPEQPSTPTTPTTPSTPAASGSYTVKKGDTWSSICTNYYGTNAQRYALMKANKGVTLKEGTVITLPEKLGKDTLIPAPVVAAGEKLYTVKAGDTLGKIAAAEYGKVSEYKAIFERNADRLKNANTIYEGQVIVLPVKK